MDTAKPVAAQTRMNLDSEFCGRVPLNQTNLVQPHGVLLVVETGSLQVLQCSENVGGFFGIAADAFAGTSLDSHLAPGGAERLRERLASGASGKFPLQLTVAGAELLFVIEPGTDYFLAEGERLDKSPGSFVEVYERLRYVMAGIESAAGTIEACDIIARELKAYSGFDKVMVYRFDKNWNGEVIAEAKEPGMDAYMGLVFPASDIPRQARELYRKNPYRLIPSVEYDPIKLHPILNPRTHSFTDLSNSNLRSVAGVHLEYLRNMGVQASMSTRILRNGELWGLIACHHREPRYLGYEACSVFEMLSNVITAKISSVENNAYGARKAEGHQLLQQVAEAIYNAGGLSVGLDRECDALLRLLQADGFALVHQRNVHRWGVTPAASDINDIVYWLQSNGERRLFAENALSSQYEQGRHYAADASGLLALPLMPDKGSFLLVFRREAVQNVNWGGDPSQAVQFEADGKRYHPRASFQLWQQTLEHTAPAWTATDEHLAESFRQFLVDYALRSA
ncbi:MAG: GAF domain-containing protein [Chitinophagaceae bacterium]|nr:MAG: GAF domain-containing protein [Chitinophagaceae bacterium]